jgi:hypothetical protein
MTTELPFGSNTIQTYLYESFSYTISNPFWPSYSLTISTTPGLPQSYLSGGDDYVYFETTSNLLNNGTEYFTLTAQDASGIVGTSSNTVIVNAGRFRDSNGNAFTGGFTFYKNEPITPVGFLAPFAITTPTATPALPPGLSFVSNASNLYSLSGTPTVTYPQSNILFIGRGTGSNAGKILTSTLPISVSNERVRLDLSGAPVVSGMTVGTAITPRTFTARYPPYPSGGVLRYTWPSLPDGIVATDASGVVRTSPFSPSDPSNTVIFRGTPTITAANAFRDAGITSNTIPVTATRTAPTPQISNALSLVFAFGETVLFDTPSVPTLYDGVAVPANVSFRAQTYFGSGSAIATIFSPDLRSDLSINFVSAQSRGYLTGTPSGSGTATYTIRAINSNNVSRDLAVPISVITDTVSFLDPTPIDVCYNYILSRPAIQDLSGYYPSPVQFKAAAASGFPITFSTTDLTGTGLTLSNVSANTVQLVGIPDTVVTPERRVRVTASAVGTPATAFRDISLAILNDVITFSEPTATQLSFIQNRAITPIQLTASTLSGRSVISFTSTTMPAGLSLSTTGLITGTPSAASGTSFTVIASTGYMSQSKTYTYTLTPDSVIFLVPQTSYTYSPSASVSIDIDGLTYSGKALSNYAFSGFSPSYGLSINSTSGVITGTLPSGLPPSDLLPPEAISYSITANAGALNGSLPATFSVSNIIVNRAFLLADNIDGGGNAKLYTNDDESYSTWTERATGGTNLSLKNTSVDSNVYLLATGTSIYYRSLNGVTWSSNFLTTSFSSEFDTAYQFLYTSNSTWYAAGTTLVTYASLELVTLAFYASANDGASWTQKGILAVSPRRSAAANNSYTSYGIASGSNSGVVLLGGQENNSSEYFLNRTLIQRSTDEGETWSNVTSGSFTKEVANFELAGPKWIATGSSYYNSGQNYDYFTEVTDTIKWSGDEGQTWSNATGAGVFNVAGRDVVYDGSGRWLASGLNSSGDAFTYVITALSYSTAGDVWYPITLPDVTFTEFDANNGMPLPEIGSIWTDDTNWYVLVKSQSSGLGYPTKILQHSLTGDLTTGWTVKAGTPTPFNGESGRRVHGFKSNYVRTGTPTTITLGFNALPPNGPTVTAPVQRTYTFYQYMAISPITIAASGTGTIYYFADADSLPVGVTFDPITATLSGTPVVLGEKSFIIYVKDNNGVTRVTITTNTIIPRIIRQQTSAGAWTSLVRQYTVVNAAQNSVDGKVLPDAPLGEFMRPPPGDSISATIDPKCRNPNC